MNKLGGKVFFENADMFAFLQTNIREPWIVETIESDIQTYGEEVLDKIFSGLNLKNFLLEVAEKLVVPISQLDKSQYKEAEIIYLDFIKFIVQNKRSLRNITPESIVNKNIRSINDDTTLEEEGEPTDHEIYENSQSHLSSLEKSALLYLKYKNLIGLDTLNPKFDAIDEDIKEIILVQKENLQVLKHFTPQGIMQLANRAGLKMIFRERS